MPRKLEQPLSAHAERPRPSTRTRACPFLSGFANPAHHAALRALAPSSGRGATPPEAPRKTPSKPPPGHLHREMSKEPPQPNTVTEAMRVRAAVLDTRESGPLRLPRFHPMDARRTHLTLGPAWRGTAERWVATGAASSRLGPPEPAERIGQDHAVVVAVVAAVPENEAEVVAAFRKSAATCRFSLKKLHRGAFQLRSRVTMRRKVLHGRPIVQRSCAPAITR